VALALKEFGRPARAGELRRHRDREKTIGKEGPPALASFTRCITVNLIGTFNMIRLAADAMAKAVPNAAGERGVIVNTASVAAYDGQIGRRRTRLRKAASSA
jgi:NAD(P)-dependent dehydrogenase (short-subunit alcohol dehydrogenase family)